MVVVKGLLEIIISDVFKCASNNYISFELEMSFLE